MIEFEKADLSWFDGLPSTPKRVLLEMIQSGVSPESAIELWLGGSRDIIQMGGSPPLGKPSYSALFLQEMKLLICTTDAKYKNVRDQIPKISKTSIASTTAIVSTAIAPHLGMAAALVAPAVVLTFFAIASIGVQVWCASSDKSKQA